MKARDVIRILLADGWYEVDGRGSHRNFKHPTKPGKVTVSEHKGRDLLDRDVFSIERQSGLKLRRR